MRRLVSALGLAAALLSAAEVRAANPPGALDLPPSNVIPAPVDITPGAPARVERSEPSGNPLWAIPLSALTATRERPLFLPSRRAPAPAVAGTPVVAALYRCRDLGTNRAGSAGRTLTLCGRRCRRVSSPRG